MGKYFPQELTSDGIFLRKILCPKFKLKYPYIKTVLAGRLIIPALRRLKREDSEFEAAWAIE